MVIVEGCDNCGKTKLIQHLATELHCEVIKSPGPQPKEALASWMMVMFQLQHIQAVIFDRFPVISEEIYGKVLRGYSELDFYGERTFITILKRMSPLIIHCRPPMYKILDLGTRPQMEGVSEHILELVAKYDYLMRILQEEGFSIIQYDYMSDVVTKDEITVMVREYFTRRGL